MKKLDMHKLGIALVMLVVLAMFFVGGTYAQYVSSVSGSDRATVAAWSFEVNGKDIARMGQEETLEFGLFDTISGNANVAPGCIAPGTCGSFDFNLKNTAQVTARYTLQLDVDHQAIPLEFSFDGEIWNKAEGVLSSSGLLQMAESQKLTVQWRWPFGTASEADTALGINPETVTVRASFVVSQYADEGEEPTEPEATEPEATEPERNVLISDEKFLYGAYFDQSKFETNDRLTSGSYGLCQAADTLLPAQDITVEVTGVDTANYCVTLGYFTKDGVYTGRGGIVKMTDGVLQISAGEIGGSYFRVSVYIYSGGFTKVPESAVITVYGQKQEENRSWEGKHISVVGDSISTGSYPATLANLTGATVKNYSKSGIKLSGTSSDSIVSKVAAMTEPTDLIIIFGGTNDYWHKGTSIGEIDSTNLSTYCGALNSILNTLKTNYPNAGYLFVFPYDQTFGGNPSSTDFGYGSLDDFRVAFVNFCTQKGVDYVDLGATEFDCAKHTGDGVHANTAGHGIIAQAILEAITNG